MLDSHSSDSPLSSQPATPTTPGKPAKPNPEYPLYAHGSGQWAKKIRGKVHYFGVWAYPDAALDNYNRDKDALHAGRKPRETTEGVTIKDVANKFIAHKQALVDTGELSPRTLAGYKEACEECHKAFGGARVVSDLDADDFAKLRKQLAKKWGPHRLGTTIQCVRCLFKHAYESGLIPAPMRYGPGFMRPTKKTMRLNRAKEGPKLFTADEIHQLIDAAGQPMKAMILLGINAGYGNTDCGNLPLSAVNLETGWIDYPRPKTGIARRCPLWPETVAALRDALAKRKEPKDKADAGLFFVTKYGDGWAKDVADSPITKEMRKLLNKLGINGHRNFYALRHTFRTIADEAKDQPAADHIMGHESPHMSSVYRERISDERLKAVTDHVRVWLFPLAPPKKAKKAGKPRKTAVNQ